VADDQRLSPTVRQTIEDPKNGVFLSAASAWEMAIKISLGRLAVDQPMDRFLTEHLASGGIDWLPIQPSHLAHLTDLPFHHKDPFDRLLAAQALAESLVIASRDVSLDAYQVQRTW
jgi:PIN domain nuclease of toxin-antitoxin system